MRLHLGPCRHTKSFKEIKSQNRARPLTTTEFLIQAFLLDRLDIAR